MLSDMHIRLAIAAICVAVVVLWWVAPPGRVSEWLHRVAWWLYDALRF